MVTAECACVVFDTWVHLAAVVDADGGTLTFYVGGVARQQVPITRGIWPALGALYMGRPPIGGPGPGSLQLAGGLDDVAIYARALVPEEIQAPLSPPPPPTRSEPVPPAPRSGERVRERGPRPRRADRKNPKQLSEPPAPVRRLSERS